MSCGGAKQPNTEGVSTDLKRLFEVLFDRYLERCGVVRGAKRRPEKAGLCVGRQHMMHAAGERLEVGGVGHQRLRPALHRCHLVGGGDVR